MYNVRNGSFRRYDARYTMEEVYTIAFMKGYSTFVYIKYRKAESTPAQCSQKRDQTVL